MKNLKVAANSECIAHHLKLHNDFMTIPRKKNNITMWEKYTLFEKIIYVILCVITAAMAGAAIYVCEDFY